MVFRQLSEVKKESRIPPLESETETQQGSSLMSTAPVKSQPLHNFSLPHLKWGKNQTSHQRCRKPSDSSRSSQNHHHNRSSTSEAESDGGSSSHHLQDQDISNHKSSVGSRALVHQNHKNRFLGAAGVDTITTVDVKTETNNSNNLLLKISKNKSGTGNGGSGGGGGEVEGEMEETMMNHWNLRPRRSIHGKNNNNDHGKGGASKNGGHHDFEEVSIQPKSLRLRGLVETDNVEKKEKIKFSIPLARDEIEEDFFAWTGSKPPRRPKKRNRTIQKALDNAFPGLWLAGITADCYNVPEHTSKHK